MHICVVGPVNARQLAPLLEPRVRRFALAQPTGNGTAPGGIIAALAAAGHRITAVTHTRGMPGLDLDGPALSYRRVPSRAYRLGPVLDRWNLERRLMANAVRASGADVVHSNWTYEAALAGLDSGLPQVATVRDAPMTVLRHYPRPMRLIRATLAYEFRIRARDAVFTAVSPYMAREWQRQALTSQDVRVIPNPVLGIADERAPEAADPYVVEIADASSRKNVRSLIEAFALVRRQVPNARLSLIGHGLEYGGHTARWAASQGLDGRVAFLGRLTPEASREELSRAWVHAHSSREESFGNTLVEAMAAGVPVVAGTSSAAVPWVVGQAGRLVDVDQPHEIAEALCRLLRNPEERQQLSEVGLARARTLFSPERVISLYEDAYRDVMSGPGR